MSRSEWCMLRAVIVLMSLCGVVSNHALSDEKLRARFIDQAPAAWEEFENRFYSSVVGEVAFVDGSSIVQQSVKVKGKGNRLLIQFDKVNPKTPSDGLVICTNAHYGFQLNGNDEAGWVVKSVVPRGSEEFFKKLDLHRDSIFRVGLSPAALYSVSLRTLVAHPDFEVLSIHNVEGEFVRVHFRLNETGRNARGAFRNLESGMLLLDPSNYWLPIEYEVKEQAQNYKVVHRYKYIYPSSRDSCLPSSGRHEISSSAASADSNISIEYNWTLDGHKLDDADFQLSAFGLPEPDWYRPPPPYWLYISIGGFVVLVIGGVLFAWGKRKMHKI